VKGYCLKEEDAARGFEEEASNLFERAVLFGGDWRWF
jgi:hypothetical protein